MFGLDHYIAGASDGTTFLIVAAVACLLGLRHATDPDHLAAVATLTAGNRSVGGSQAARLGLSWGIGHATSLFAFGLPIVLFKAYLPENVQRGAEVAVGFVIVALAVWLLLRWHRGLFHAHLHEHGGVVPSRSPLQAYGIGLVHGTGGSAGVGVLLLATIHDQLVACLALALFAVCTALSMALLSTGFGLTLASGPVRRGFHRVVPVLALASLAFGVWYSLGALDMTRYTF